MDQFLQVLLFFAMAKPDIIEFSVGCQLEEVLLPLSESLISGNGTFFNGIS